MGGDDVGLYPTRTRGRVRIEHDGVEAPRGQSTRAVLTRDKVLFQNIVEKDGRKQLATCWQYRSNGGLVVKTEYETYHDPERQLTLF